MPIAVVTGAGIRVGRAIALALGANGFDVVLHVNRSTEPALEVKAKLEAMGRRAFVEAADLSDGDAVAKLAQRLRADHPVVEDEIGRAHV